MKVLSLFGLACLFLLIAGSASARQQHPPGSPLEGVELEIHLLESLHRLPTQVEEGDVVLLKHGASQRRGNWLAVVHFHNRPFRESTTGYASLTYTNFSSVTLHPNVVFVTASQGQNQTHYHAKRNAVPNGAHYYIHHVHGQASLNSNNERGSHA